ncbi:Lar family restriction alleviation protein [Caballeronia sp. LZ028]|uniref:Lar family restriction alleviation protein n=1 Tax=Caballeronia sp. LZ028 TaxID=3038563 RepID=UPI0028596D98|nr:Lar family restriction alleviation protein [Caballeronia sp. LZ028]MDR5765002.1 Lar family restriction alleviation protein [Caballeronia sp. LZ028]
MTEKLKPCPFCGADAVLTEHEPHDHSPGLVALTGIPAKHPGSWTVECVACSCGMIHGTREEVEAAWNRRALSASIADTAGAKPVAWLIDWPDEPELGHYFAENPVDQMYGRSRPLTFAAPPAPSVADAAGASESLPDNIDWTRVMALAEKHGDGWSEAKGWSFHCDDDLFNFAGELAKESGND